MADREHRIAWAVNEAGYVFSVIVVNADCSSLTGWRKRLAEAARDAAPAWVTRHPPRPIDPADIEWGGIPVDADGRALSAIETGGA